MQHKFEGMGGSYALDPETGELELVERTGHAGAGPDDPLPKKEPKQAKPAEAGFLTSSIPAPPSDATKPTEQP